MLVGPSYLFPYGVPHAASDLIEKLTGVPVLRVSWTLHAEARWFVGLTIGSGSLLIAIFLSHGVDPSNLRVFLAYSVFALVASMLKVRLPGLNGAISLNFLFVLAAIALFPLTEAVLTACVGALVQCIIWARHRDTLLQLLFNAAALAMSSALSYRVAHLLDTLTPHKTTMQLVVGASSYSQQILSWLRVPFPWHLVSQCLRRGGSVTSGHSRIMVSAQSSQLWESQNCKPAAR